MTKVIYPSERLEIWIERKYRTPDNPSLIQIIINDGCLLESFDTPYGLEYNCPYPWDCGDCPVLPERPTRKEEEAKKWILRKPILKYM